MTSSGFSFNCIRDRYAVNMNSFRRLHTIYSRMFRNVLRASQICLWGFLLFRRVRLIHLYPSRDIIVSTLFTNVNIYAPVFYPEMLLRESWIASRA